MSREFAELAELLGRRAVTSRLLVMVAGPDRAGKSTFYDAYLHSLGLPFINADRIAVECRVGSRVVPLELSELPADQAAQRAADEERHASIILLRSFVTETVVSDPVGAKIAMLNAAAAEADDKIQSRYARTRESIRGHRSGFDRCLARRRSRGGTVSIRCSLRKRLTRSLVGVRSRVGEGGGALSPKNPRLYLAVGRRIAYAPRAET